jgi:4-amino-4-deoxy-L-arabinose transferase-like glycosyltransferase
MKQTPISPAPRFPSSARAFDGGRSLIVLGRSRSTWLTVALICLTAAWFGLLGARALYDPDEGRYAEIPREMLRTDDWILPHLNGLVYLEKPPLQYWLTALSLDLLGESEGAARLVTGVAGYLTLIVTLLLARTLWGIRAGVKALCLTCASTLFVLLGHQLTLDMLLTFFMTCSVACFLMAQSQRSACPVARRWMLGCWAAMALATMTKGPIGLVLPALSGLGYLLWQRDWAVLRALNIRWGLPLFVAIAAPWYVLAAATDPLFLRFFFVREHVERFLTPVEHRSQPWWFYIAVVTVGILPWLPLALKSMAATCRATFPAGEFHAARLLLMWNVVIVVFFSCSDAKLVTYVLPIVPTLALLCASRAEDDRAALFGGAVLTLATGAAIVAYAHGAWASHKYPQLAEDMRVALWLIATLLAAGAVLCLFLLQTRRHLAALPVLGAAWLLGSFGLLIGGTQIEPYFSAKLLAQHLRQLASPATPVYAVQIYDQSLAFYLRRPVTLVDYRDEFALGLDQSPQLGIADLQRFSLVWRALPEGYAVMRPKTLDILRSQGLPMREVARYAHRIVVSRR